MLNTIAKVFGIVLVAIGVLGFIPALTPDNHLLGIFHVDAIHNVIHLASGIVALAAGFASDKAARMYFQIFGIVYGLVAVLGIFSGNNDILGLIANNTADVILHILIAGSALYFGFVYGRQKPAEPAAPTGV
jgi:hypothetical protein